MTLQNLLSEKRQEILNQWFDETIKSYPENTATFLRDRKNRFANPVGQIILDGLDKLLTALSQNGDMAESSAFLDNIIRIRAVQDLVPSQAVSFIASLKDIIRTEAAAAGGGHEFRDDLLLLEARIDQLLLMAFDNYMQCKEKLYEIKANEVRRMTFRLLQRANEMTETLDKGQGLEGSTTL